MFLLSLFVSLQLIASKPHEQECVRSQNLWQSHLFFDPKSAYASNTREILLVRKDEWELSSEELEYNKNCELLHETTCQLCEQEKPQTVTGSTFWKTATCEDDLLYYSMKRKALAQLQAQGHFDADFIQRWEHEIEKHIQEIAYVKRDRESFRVVVFGARNTYPLTHDLRAMNFEERLRWMQTQGITKRNS